jgi:hypothetical protein
MTQIKPIYFSKKMAQDLAAGLTKAENSPPMLVTESTTMTSSMLNP